MIKYLLITLMLSSNITAYASNSYNTSEVDSFVNEMHEKYDYKKDDLKKLFANIREEQKLKKFFKKAPERRLTWNGCDSIEEQCINYKKLFVNKYNIENGKLFIEKNNDYLNKAYSAFGVPREIITAIIGIETRYGKNLGKFKTFDTLASLSWDLTKAEELIYRTELINFLLLCRENNSIQRQLLAHTRGH